MRESRRLDTSLSSINQFDHPNDICLCFYDHVSNISSVFFTLVSILMSEGPQAAKNDQLGSLKKRLKKYYEKKDQYEKKK